MFHQSIKLNMRFFEVVDTITRTTKMSHTYTFTALKIELLYPLGKDESFIVEKRKAAHDVVSVLATSYLHVIVFQESDFGSFM